MPKYNVMLPVAGYVSCEVEAESEDEAIEKAKDVDFSTSDIEEWNVYVDLMKGNVCQAEYVEAVAEEIEDE